jgi:large conductance mechanosensitive channel
MNKLKKWANEFKTFITKGNVVDMAVAVIIGAAFSAIVTALTNGILLPIIKWATGGEDGVGLITMLKAVYTAGVDEAGNATTVIDYANSIYIDWGTFINKIVDFILVALVLFIIIKIYMGLQNARNNAKEALNGKKAKLARKYVKQGLSLSEAEAKAQADIDAEAAAAAAAEAEAKANAAPTTDELLTQIRDILAENNKKN